MKKDLIVVGNKPPLKNNIDLLIDSFDYVIRVGRMNYYNVTGRRIDGIFLEANVPFKYYYKGGEFKEFYKTAKQIFMCQFWYLRFWEWGQYLTEDQFRSVEIIDDNMIAQKVGFNRLTSAIRIISHLLNSEWNERYTIHFICLDVENRAMLIDNDDYWLYHKGAGIFEKNYLLEQIASGHLLRIYE